MTRRRQLRAALTAWMLFQCVMPLAARQQPAKVTVKGVVRDARTDQPITGAQVTLTSTTTSPFSSDAAKPPSVNTDTNGEFAVSLDAQVLSAYRLSVASNGYVRNETTLGVPPGDTKDDIAVRMAQTASVSGHIGTTTGQPVAGISVQIQRRTYNENGTITFTTVATTKTNDLGDYRAYFVTPGRYYVKAGLLGTNLDDLFGFDYAGRQGRNEVTENYPPTFFPGVVDASKAVAVELAHGADVRGIDFTMPPQNRPYSIRGRVIDSSTGQSPAKVNIVLSSVSTWLVAPWYDGATGTFEIRNVVPGHYGLLAEPAGNADFPTGLIAGGAVATLVVPVVDSDVDNLTLTITPPPVVAGRLRFEGQLPATLSMEYLRVNLTDVSSTNPFQRLTPSVAVSPDGTFRMNAPVEGAFRVTVSGLPGYLKDVRFNNASILNVPARLSTGGSLEIVAGANSGQIIGRVLDDQSKPFAGAVVVAVPNTSRERPELFKRFGIATGDTGYFVIGGLAPGDYKVFAWERIEANSFYDPEVLKKYEELGTPVRIVEGSRENLDVKVIPAEAAP